MKNPVQLTKSIDPVKDSRTRSPWRGGFLLILLAVGVACFALPVVVVRAECRDGCDDLGDPYVGNTFLGEDALINNTTGNANTAMGYKALITNTTGEDNTAIGDAALHENTTGFFNTAVGVSALFHSTTASNNTAIGAGALDQNSTGSNNTATGFEAMANVEVGSSSTGSYNTANGALALFSITTGSWNTANGANALYGNTNGILNTATGFAALYANTGGSYNTADGYQALSSNTTGINNVACGISALFKNTTGSNNIAVGPSAGSALTTGSNNIHIGNAGVAGESNKIHIGTVGIQNRTFIAGISGVTVPAGVGVIIGTDGKLGTVVSSERFKGSIKPMDKASEVIHALKPVTFRYKQEFDPEGIAQFGLVAEEVAKVNPDLVARDDQGKPYTVRYEAVNAMLLNEFIKEHRRVEAQARINREQEATITGLQKQIAALTAALKEQAAQIQNVSAELAVSKVGPRLVANKP